MHAMDTRACIIGRPRPAGVAVVLLLVPVRGPSLVSLLFVIRSGLSEINHSTKAEKGRAKT